jgi:hypothetical protein
MSKRFHILIQLLNSMWMGWGLKLTKGKVAIQQESQIAGFLLSLCIWKEVCTLSEYLIAR